MRSENRKYFLGILGLGILAALLMLGSHARERKISRDHAANVDDAQTEVKALGHDLRAVSNGKSPTGGGSHLSSPSARQNDSSTSGSANDGSGKEPGELFLAKLLEIKEREGKDNALIYYVQAGLLMPLNPDEQQSNLIKQVLAEGWDPRAESLLPYMMAYTNAFDLIRKGNDIEYARGIGFEDGAETPVPNFLRIQTGSKMLAVYGRYLESQGKTGEALEQYISALKMGAHFRSEGNTLISNLIGTAGEHISLRQMGRLAETGALDSSQVRSLLDTINKVELANGGVERPYRDEMEMVKTTTRKVAENPSKYLGMDGTDEQKDAVRKIAAEPDRYLAEIQYLEEQVLKYHSVPYWQRTDAMRAELEECGDSLSFPIREAAQINALEVDARHLVVSSKLRQTMVAGALHAYRNDTGSFPERLDQLTSKGYFSEVPTDPFSGKSFEYSVKNGKYELGGAGPKLGKSTGQPLYDPTNGSISDGVIRLH